MWQIKQFETNNCREKWGFIWGSERFVWTENSLWLHINWCWLLAWLKVSLLATIDHFKQLLLCVCLRLLPHLVAKLLWVVCASHVIYSRWLCSEICFPIVILFISVCIFHHSSEKVWNKKCHHSTFSTFNAK